jgi:hypothetical protein
MLADNRPMIRGALFMAALALASSAHAAGDAPSCAECFALPAGRETRPLRIEIESGLQFSRLALRGQADGEAEIDPQTGAKRVSNLIDLGGLSWQGRARITGEPLRPVRIVLPPRVVLQSPDGSEAVLTDFVTNLPQAVMLDQSGTLEFAFGARLSTQGAGGGNFRGRIRIEVEYY